MNLKKVSFFLLAAGMLFQACSNGKKEKTTSAQIAVTVQEVKAIEVPKAFNYSGTVASVKQSTLSTRLMGQIEKILVHEGEKVEKGQLLLALRSNDILAKQKQVEANIVEVTAAYRNAETDLNRISALYASKSATKKELDDINTHYEMMQAKLEAVKKAKAEVTEMLTYSDIRAPYAGVITSRFVDAGDMANPGMPLLAIEAPGLFEVNAHIPESEIHLIERNDTVMVTLNGVEGDIAGVVSRINPSSRFSGSQFDTRIVLLPEVHQIEDIRSGLFAHVNLYKGKEEKVLVPESLVIDRGQLTGLWTVSQSDQALLRWVRLGKQYADRIEVLSGIQKGDRLILQSQGRLHDGASLQIN